MTMMSGSDETAALQHPAAPLLESPGAVLLEMLVNNIDGQQQHLRAPRRGAGAPPEHDELMDLDLVGLGIELCAGLAGHEGPAPAPTIHPSQHRDLPIGGQLPSLPELDSPAVMAGAPAPHLSAPASQPGLGVGFMDMDLDEILQHRPPSRTWGSAAVQLELQQRPKQPMWCPKPGPVLAPLPGAGAVPAAAKHLGLELSPTPSVSPTLSAAGSASSSSGSRSGGHSPVQRVARSASPAGSTDAESSSGDFSAGEGSLASRAAGGGGGGDHEARVHDTRGGASRHGRARARRVLQQPTADSRRKWKCTPEWLLNSITDSERKKLLKAGIRAPPVGATPDQVGKARLKVLREGLRKIRNVVSAQRSRVKQKEYIQTLEGEVATLESELADADGAIARLATEKRSLATENSSLLQQLAELRQRLSGSGTAMMMVVVCCGIGAVNSTGAWPGSSSGAGGFSIAPSGFQPRTLLTRDALEMAVVPGLLGASAVSTVCMAFVVAALMTISAALAISLASQPNARLVSIFPDLDNECDTAKGSAIVAKANATKQSGRQARSRAFRLTSLDV